MERLKEGTPERERLPEGPGEYFEVQAYGGTWAVSARMADHIERELSRFRAPEWIVFVTLHGARVRVRAATILSMAQASPEQREGLRAFHKALEEEETDDPWAD